MKGNSIVEIFLLANGLLLIGASLLIAALFPVRRLIVLLPSKQMRRKWYLLTGLILVFIVSYLGYTAAFWNLHDNWNDLIVPVVFFSGACFVWSVSTFSQETAVEMLRVARENITDPLTGVNNRRYLDRRLEEEVTRARRYALPFSILLIDIDHFKLINDTYGHQVGDQVLVSYARLLKDTSRKTDVVARYGGEEFLIIAPSTPGEEAVRLAERIRHEAEIRQFAVRGKEGQQERIHITVSIGVANLGDEIDSLEKLMQCADQALYRAKNEGRNRVLLGSTDMAELTGH